MLFEIISERLQKAGFTRSRKQVKQKLKTIKAKFYKVKDSNTTSGQKRVEFELYDICFSIWGHMASADPVRLLSSTQMNARSIVTDANDDRAAPTSPASSV
ncbi:PREDICTED: uncharacterized protein LOC106815743 [Priapulus caudatus]|uniref:Uncharacterized protein LOC106815743 n=1 Tax=Priapulus caudatus TaxID=37621 RepID=A0ABM1EU67_PRICU|nr:PREDICTED: uncharacterized protein LOC106815743 [Priapulus caudatus]